MNSSITVVLTDTAIALLSKNAVLTSIPLRRWTSNNGSTWSGRLRPHTEVTWLIERLRTTLRNDGADSVMKRVLQVMSEEPPPLSPKTELKTENESRSTKITKVVKTLRKAVKTSTIGRYMAGAKAPILRTGAVTPCVRARPIHGRGLGSSSPLRTYQRGALCGDRIPGRGGRP
jgi:hypothetical protein